MAISAKTGLKPITIDYDNGERVEFYYNPSDPNFFNALYKMKENITNAMNNLNLENINTELLEKTTEGNIENLSDEEKEATEKAVGDTLGAIDSVSNIFSNEIDKVFKGNASEKIFKYMSPFTIMENGQSYVEYILAEIFKEVGAVVKENQKRMIRKHTKKNK